MTESRSMNASTVDVSEVRETDLPDVVNGMLKKGWVLLNTYVEDKGEEKRKEKIWYCLGLPR